MTKHTRTRCKIQFKGKSNSDPSTPYKSYSRADAKRRTVVKEIWYLDPQPPTHPLQLPPSGTKSRPGLMYIMVHALSGQELPAIVQGSD